MIHKFEINRDPEKHTLTIKEYASVGKSHPSTDSEDIFSCVCREAHDDEIIKAAVSTSRQAIVLCIRTQNMYPISHYADRIADSISDMYTDRRSHFAELKFDDLELF